MHGEQQTPTSCIITGTVVAPPLPQALLVTNPNNPLGRLLQSCTCVLIAVCNRVSTYVGAAGHQPQQPARHDLQR